MAIEIDEFRRLIETHQRMVFSLCLRITGDYATAEEVAQDVFLELHRSGERLTSADHIRFWLRRVTVHRATDALRRKALRPEARAEEWMDDQYVGPSEGGSGIGIQARIEELLRAIPEPLRVAIVLRYQEEMVPRGDRVRSRAAGSDGQESSAARSQTAPPQGGRHDEGVCP